MVWRRLELKHFMKKLLATLFLLAAIPVMAGAPYVVTPGGIGKTNTFFDTFFKVTSSAYGAAYFEDAITHIGGAGGNISGGISLTITNQYATNRSGIYFYDLQGGGNAVIRWEPDHGGSTGTSPELGFLSSGKQAIGWALEGPNSPDRDYQFGISGLQRAYVCFSTEGRSANGSLTVDGLPWARASMMSFPVILQGGNYGDANGNPQLAPSYTSTTAKAGPGFSAYPYDSYGRDDFVIWSYFDAAIQNSTGTNDWNWSNSKRAIEILSVTTNMPVGGVIGVQERLSGSLIYERTNYAGTTGTNFALDFGKSQCVDITFGTTAANFYTTNQTGSPTNFEERVFLIRAAGYSVSLSYPSLWATNGTALPTTISGADMLRLSLNAIGSGESNVIAVSAGIYKDNSFSYDSSTTYFLNRIGGTDLAHSNALNNLILTLKSSGTWAKLDALYPFCWTGASNTLNIITNTCTLVQHGTITVNDATGITGDGSTGYFDTGWRSTTNQNAGAMFLYTKTDGGTGGSFWACGAYDGSVNAVGIRHNGGTGWGTFFNSSIGGGGSVSAYSFPDSVMVARTASTGVGSLVAYGAAVTTPANDTSGTAPPLNSYLLALNNNGSPGAYWSGKMQGVALSHQILTAGDYAALRSAFQALNTSLSR